MKEARQKVTVGHAVITQTLTDLELPFDPAHSHPQRQVDIETGWWNLDGSQFSMFLDYTKSASYKTDKCISMRMVADAARIRALQESGDAKKPAKLFHVGWDMPRNGSLHHGLWQASIWLDPRFQAYFSHILGSPPLFEPPVDELISTTAFPVKYAGRELVAGSPCERIEIFPNRNNELIYWIDTAHGFVIRRSEVYQLLARKLRLKEESTATRLVESHGIWLPALTETRHYLYTPERFFHYKGTGIQIVPPINIDQWKNEGPLRRKLSSTTRITISNFAADRMIPPAEFRLEWPVGTRIRNTGGPDYSVVKQQSGPKTASALDSTPSYSEPLRPR